MPHIRLLTHLIFEGHGAPGSWNTHWPGEFNWGDTPGGIDLLGIMQLSNKEKLPVCVIGGCHNSQFNITLLSTILNQPFTWNHGAPAAECFAWHLTRKIGGGTISALGNTGLGYGAVGEHGDLDGDGITEPDILEKLGGFYFDQFYQVFDEGAIILGDVHSGALNNYLDVHPGMDYQADAKTMQQMALLGDPSLKIGGYTSGNQFTAEIVDAAAGVLAEPGEEVAFQADSSNGQGQITYEWDLDNDGSYDDAEGESAFWSWNLPGVSWVSVKATDGAGKTDTYDTIVAIKYGASKPSIPAGPTSIKAGVKYSYSGTVNTQSGYWNKVFYKFSWGDGSETDWLETSSASHYWTIQGNYKVKVKALLAHESVNIDESDFEDSKETEWSDPLTVTLPRTRSSHTSLLQLILNFFERHTNMFPILEYILGI